MALQNLEDFLAASGKRPYRKLIEHHLRKQSAREMNDALQGELDLLPAEVRPFIEAFLDQVNDAIGYDRDYWSTASCMDAATDIAVAGTFAIPEDAVHDGIVSLRRSGRDLRFALFQIATLNFACSASLHKKQRKFMGISKGLFG